MERIADIIESIANEKGLETQDVKERVIRAIINTAKKIYGENYEYDAVIDNATKTLHLYQKITVVEDGDERLAEDNEHFLSISEAKKSRLWRRDRRRANIRAIYRQPRPHRRADASQGA